MRPETNCLTECTSACLCAWLCGINAVILTPPKIAIDLLSTIFCFLNQGTTCAASRHEINYGRMLFEANRKNQYHQFQVPHTISETQREEGCMSACFAPYASTLFACCGIKEAVRNKYCLGGESTLKPTVGYAGIQ